jgi:hypothetical protein
MPSYFFHLKTPNETIRDTEGTQLPGETAAHEHARLVAGELMRNQEPSRRAWRLQVCDSEGRQAFQLLFASVDDTISHFSPDLRSSIEDMHAQKASLDDAI